MLAILTIDLDRGMYSLDRDGVMAGAQVVYGSDGQAVRRQPPLRARDRERQRRARGHETEIHRFDITDPSKTVYRATGTVPGFVLNNYALSEFEGKLRVATTEEPAWFNGASRASSRAR